MKNSNQHSSLEKMIVQNAAEIYRNESPDNLIAQAAEQEDASVSPKGIIFAKTGKFTGRSVQDKYIVRNAQWASKIWWDNNNAMSPEQFETLKGDMLKYAADEKIWHQQLRAGRGQSTPYRVNVFSQSAWHSLFIRHLLIRPDAEELANFAPNTTILHLPAFQANPIRHGTRSDTVIALDLEANIVLICGTFYAGEIKKSVFSLFCTQAPDQNILPMHGSANLSKDGQTTLFFGLSGTGKTTLSADPTRELIGDDEHGWSDEGIFNLEGGCYAKAINLREESEPEIFGAAQVRGAVLENVTFDPKTFAPDYNDDSATENTRIAYPLDVIDNVFAGEVAPAPTNIVLLTADAFGVLPPLARLTDVQAVQFFLLGYTAKLAGTERGVTTPKATFSTCFGAPFMSRFPAVYGELFANRLAQSGANCWLLNTGWTGGAYGVGERMSLKVTRRLLSAALDGELDNANFAPDPIFNLMVPQNVEGVDAGLLDPRSTWADPQAYDVQAKDLAEQFATGVAKLGEDASELIERLQAQSKAA